MLKEFLICTAILLIFYVIIKGLPKFLQFLGLHPNYDKHNFDLSGKKALIITTSHDQLSNGKATGVFASEMTVPYYEFLDAKMRVDVASIDGGQIPIEPFSLQYPIASEADKRFREDEVFQAKVNESLKIDRLDFSNYDVVFLAGGWGAAWDLGTSEVLGEKITQANQADALLGAVCHGPLGFVQAKEKDGTPLLAGKQIAAVTNKQIAELLIKDTPMHPETEMKNAGAEFKSRRGLLDVLSTNVVVDGNLVTGQNQNSAGETAQLLLSKLFDKQTKK